MRDRMERLVVLPFSMGCVSHSSIDVATTTSPSKKPKIDSNPILFTRRVDEDMQCEEKEKNSWVLVSLPKPNVSHGIQKLLRSFKSFSQIFVYKEGEEEMEIEMEIGLPTDVKHVSHIGWDGSTTTNPPLNGNNWDINTLKAQPEILSFPSISLRQFELAMAAQAADPPAPSLHLNNNFTSN
ncbi:hypothetical protein LguiB_013339 [Lonicera macranthoides]